MDLDNEQKFYNEEVLDLLKQLVVAIKRQQTKPVVNVDAPNVTVEPTPVVVEQKEVVIPMEALENALQGVTKRLNDTLDVKISNPQAQKDKIEVKNLKQVEKLLKELLKKDTVVKVETKAPIVNVPDIKSYNAKEFVPVRLTDGQQFYNAISSIAFPGRKREPFEDYGIYATIKDDFGYDYFGYENEDGKWAIKRRNRTTGVFDYAVGKSDIDTAWGGRTMLVYDKISNIKI